MKNLSLAQPKVYVIHENPEWAAPLFQVLEAIGVPHAEYLAHDALLNAQQEPPPGIYYSKISASAHTRGNDAAIAFALPLIQWLEGHDRRVINGVDTMLTEVSKARQHLLLAAAGIRTPYTIVASNSSQLMIAAQGFCGKSFIVKPNRGGKGLGVQLFDSEIALAAAITSNDIFSIDGIYIIQEYIQPPKSQIVRMEFIGGKFHYAVAVDTTDGFELCPADACAIDNTGGEIQQRRKHKFEVIPAYQNPDLAQIEGFLKDQKIDIAGIEYVENDIGQRFVYDINTNTNYNKDAESRAGVQPGIDKLAEYLKGELTRYYPEAL